MGRSSLSNTHAKNICVVVNSRANYGRIKSVLVSIHEHKGLKLQLVVGASALLYRFGKVIDVIENDGFSVDAKLYSIVEGENPVTMIGNNRVSYII